jgi:hypothetical protein
MARRRNARLVQSNAISLLASGKPIGTDSITCGPWASTRLLAVGHRRCVNRRHLLRPTPFTEDNDAADRHARNRWAPRPTRSSPATIRFADCAGRPPPLRVSKFGTCQTTVGNGDIGSVEHRLAKIHCTCIAIIQAAAQDGCNSIQSNVCLAGAAPLQPRRTAPLAPFSEGAA